jgi:hypothetical protein
VGLALALPVANWLLTSGIFYFLMLPRAASQGAGACDREHVSFYEMSLLIGSSWLLNYLPLSPGLFGRVAYHKAVHRVPVATSVAVVAWVFGLRVVVVGAMLCLVMFAGRDMSIGKYGLLLGSPAAVLLVLGWIGKLGGRCRGAWRFAAAAGLRWLDVLVWMARYAVVFELLGRRLTLAEAGAIAAVSQAAMQVPLLGNGLGIREWAVGLVGPVLPEWMNAGAGGLTRGLGLSADLLNRGFELASALPIGLLCTVLVARMRANAGAGMVAGPLAFRSQEEEKRS